MNSGSEAYCSVLKGMDQMIQGFSKDVESWKRRAELAEAEKTELAGQVSSLTQNVQKLETGNSKLQGELAERAEDNKTISRNNSQLRDKVQAFEKESSVMKNDLENLRRDKQKMFNRGKKLVKKLSKVFELEDDEEISTASDVNEISDTHLNVQCKPQCQESEYNHQNGILNYLKDIHSLVCVNLVNHGRTNTDIENLSAKISVLNEWRMKVETESNTQISGQQQQVFQGGNANNSSNNETFSVPKNQSESYNENCMPDITSDRYAGSPFNLNQNMVHERQRWSTGANPAGMSNTTMPSRHSSSMIDDNLQAGNYQPKQANCSNLGPKLASAECAAAIQEYSGNEMQWNTSNDQGEHINNPSNLEGQYGNETCTQEVSSVSPFPVPSISLIQANLRNYQTIQGNPEPQPVEEQRSVRRENNIKRVPSATDKDTHRYIGTTNGKYYCLCGTYCSVRSQIASHIRSKTEEKKFKCFVGSCNEPFYFPYLLRKHLQSKHGDNVDRPNTCYGCYQLFQTKYSLKTHLNKRNEACYRSKRAHLSKRQRKAFETLTQTQDQPHIIIKKERADDM